MTKELNALWDQVRGWCHPEYPFLDSVYSPGSLMPACDFTLWIRDRLIANDVQSVRALFAYIAPDHTLFSRQFEAFFTWRVPGFDGALEAELRAVMMLCYRYGWVHDFRHLCHDWVHLVSVTLPVNSALASPLSQVPPTTRLVASSPRAVTNSTSVRLDYSSGYGQRCYGANEAWNKHFIEALALFKVPDHTEAFPPQFATIEQVRAVASELGVNLRSEKKSGMMAEASHYPNLMARLWSDFNRGVVFAAPGIETELTAWQSSIRSLVGTAQELVTASAISFMQHDHEGSDCLNVDEAFDDRLKSIFESHRQLAVKRRESEREAESESVSDYSLDPDDFIGGQAAIDRLTAEWRARQN